MPRGPISVKENIGNNGDNDNNSNYCNNVGKGSKGNKGNKGDNYNNGNMCLRWSRKMNETGFRTTNIWQHFWLFLFFRKTVWSSNIRFPGNRDGVSRTNKTRQNFRFLGPSRFFVMSEKRVEEGLITSDLDNNKTTATATTTATTTMTTATTPATMMMNMIGSFASLPPPGMRRTTKLIDLQLILFYYLSLFFFLPFCF